MQDEETLEREIFSLLNQKYYVPQNQTRHVTRELIDAIRDARNNRADVAPTLFSILEKHSGRRIFSYDVDVQRPEKDELFQILDTKNILLIMVNDFSGIFTFCSSHLF